MSVKTDNEAAWREKLCFQTPTYIEHEVAKKTQRFYPVSVGLLFMLRRVGVAFVESLALFFVNTNNDVRTSDKTITDKEGYTQRDVVIDPVSFEMAQYRDDQKKKAWTKALEAVLADENQAVIGELIMDSLREVFPREGFTGKFVDGPDPKEFLKEMPLPMLTGFLIGVAKANKDVIGPLGAKAKSIFDLAEKQLTEKLAPAAKPTDPT